MRIVVNTPTGNIGRSLVQTLLDRGAEVTLVARTRSKVQDFEARGARVVEGSIDDAAVLDKAFEGADGLFWLSPPRTGPTGGRGDRTRRSRQPSWRRNTGSSGSS